MPVWLLVVGVVLVLLAVALGLAPRLRDRPPRGAGPAPRGSTGDGDDGLLHDPDGHAGPPTMGRDPHGPPGP